MLQAIYGVDQLSDLYSIVPPDGNLFIPNGKTARNDRPPLVYEYNSGSTATDDGDNVIKPNSIGSGSPGRYLKRNLDYPQLVNSPSLAPVAISGSYTDLTNKPTIPAAQVNSDWNASSGISQIQNKPSLSTVATSGAYGDLSGKPSVPNPQQAYEGATLRANAFPIIMSATVGSGVAVFQLTTNGLAAGAPIFPTGVIQDSINLFVNDATAAYQMSFAFTNSNKTLTVTANKLTTANILTGLLGQAAANGAVIKLQVWGY